MRTALTTTLSDQDIRALREFHGHLCPMVLLGARLAKEAVARLGRENGEGHPFAFFRGGGCALDGVQVISGCTWGNGNLVIIRGRDYGLLMALEGRERGILVRPRPDLLEGIRRADSPSFLNSETGRDVVEGASDRVMEVFEKAIPAYLTLYPENPPKGSDPESGDGSKG